MYATGAIRAAPMVGPTINGTRNGWTMPAACDQKSRVKSPYEKNTLTCIAHVRRDRNPHRVRRGIVAPANHGTIARADWR